MNSDRKQGDWNCESCHHLNFSRRDYCQRCRAPRPDIGLLGDSGRAAGAVLTSLDVRPGDWYCTCGYHNFASRTSCFSCGAATAKGSSHASGGACEGGGTRARAAWKAGDWMCTRPGCNVHNFASRTECYGCNAPRETSNEN